MLLLPKVDSISSALLAFVKFNNCGRSVSPTTPASALISYRWHATIVSVVNLDVILYITLNVHHFNFKKMMFSDLHLKPVL